MALWFIFFVIFAKDESKEVYGYSDMFLTSNASPWLEITPTKRTIEEMVMSTAKEFNIDPELFLRIAYCESGLQPDIKNASSTASGIFQFLTSTFLRYAQAYELPTDNKNDPEVQAELAARMIADGGLGHWNASRSCWENY